MSYNEQYYKKLNYVTYLDRKPKYVKHVHEITMLLKSFNLIKHDSSILDYGCAVGFLIEGFKEYGYNNIQGYDISDWAVQQCEQKNIEILKSISNSNYDLICCLDVLEHMSDEQILDAFSKLNGNMMLVRIPCSSDGKDFHLDISKVDPTHCNCKTKTQWVDLLKKLGYNFFMSINTNTIYDSEGVMCYLCFKENIL